MLKQHNYEFINNNNTKSLQKNNNHSLLSSEMNFLFQNLENCKQISKDHRLLVRRYLVQNIREQWMLNKQNIIDDKSVNPKTIGNQNNQNQCQDEEEDHKNNDIKILQNNNQFNHMQNLANHKKQTFKKIKKNKIQRQLIQLKQILLNKDIVQVQMQLKKFIKNLLQKQNQNCTIKLNIESNCFDGLNIKNQEKNNKIIKVKIKQNHNFNNRSGNKNEKPKRKNFNYNSNSHKEVTKIAIKRNKDKKVQTYICNNQVKATQKLKNKSKEKQINDLKKKLRQCKSLQKIIYKEYSQEQKSIDDNFKQNITSHIGVLFTPKDKKQCQTERLQSFFKSYDSQKKQYQKSTGSQSKNLFQKRIEKKIKSINLVKKPKQTKINVNQILNQIKAQKQQAKQRQKQQIALNKQKQMRQEVTQFKNVLIINENNQPFKQNHKEMQQDNQLIKKYQRQGSFQLNKQHFYFSFKQEKLKKQTNPNFQQKQSLICNIDKQEQLKQSKQSKQSYQIEYQSPSFPFKKKSLQISEQLYSHQNSTSQPLQIKVYENKNQSSFISNQQSHMLQTFNPLYCNYSTSKLKSSNRTSFSKLLNFSSVKDKDKDCSNQYSSKLQKIQNREFIRSSQNTIKIKKFKSCLSKVFAEDLYCYIMNQIQKKIKQSEIRSCRSSKGQIEEHIIQTSYQKLQYRDFLKIIQEYLNQYEKQKICLIDENKESSFILVPPFSSKKEIVSESKIIQFLQIYCLQSANKIRAYFVQLDKKSQKIISKQSFSKGNNWKGQKIIQSFNNLIDIAGQQNKINYWQFYRSQNLNQFKQLIALYFK